jgi:hypothetical protein
MLIHCCNLLDFLYELYYDAVIHEQQAYNNSIICEGLQGYPQFFGGPGACNNNDRPFKKVEIIIQFLSVLLSN